MSKDHFTPADNGMWYGAPTDRAIACADGDNDKLACISLAALLKQLGKKVAWEPWWPTRLLAGDTWEVGVRANRCPEHWLMDVEPSFLYEYTLAAHVYRGIVLFQGITSSLNWERLRDAHSGPVPIESVLRISDWLAGVNDKE